METESIEKFDLSKIKEYFNNIDELEGKFVQGKSKYQSIRELNQNIKKIIEEKEKPIYLGKVENILEKLDKIHKSLMQVTQNNLQSLLTFQDKLTKNYKQVYLDKLKNLDLTNQKTKKIGLNLIKNKNISKIVKKPSITPSLKVSQWSRILDSLKDDGQFIECIKKVESFYSVLLEHKFNKELAQIPEDVDKTLINDYKRAFLEDPSLSFKNFMRHIEAKLTEEELEHRRGIIEKTKKDEELASLKETQEQQKRTFEDYFKYTEKEFQRIRRKKERKSLSEIANKPKKEKSLDDKKMEKIEKFKSKFEDSFEKKYIQQEDEEDPLDLVRKRKKKKNEEYKDFLKKFKENSKE